MKIRKRQNKIFKTGKCGTGLNEMQETREEFNADNK